MQPPDTVPLTPDLRAALHWLLDGDTTGLDNLSEAAFFPRSLAARLRDPLPAGIAYLGDSV